MLRYEGEIKFHTLCQRYCLHLNPYEFSVKEKARQKDLWGSVPSFAGDIDESGDLEFIFISNDGDISLYKRRGRAYKKIQKLISDQNHIFNITYDYNSEANYGQMIIKTIDRNIVFSYAQNRNYYLGFMIYFLELQLCRFSELFEYVLEVDASIDVANVRIPKMLIQNFAENAVKHAFQDVDYMGKIEIKCMLDEDKNVCISFTDNGIGIDKSTEGGHTSGTKLGNRLIEKQIEMINQLYKLDIGLSINDRSKIAPFSSGTTIFVALNYGSNFNVQSRNTNHT
ncbi:MAG: ATP-binding protein [Bacteroidales bacterium]|jgi:hypothetical protein|nr:ATP-binding protein [Bacteroidales bacterium]